MKIGIITLSASDNCGSLLQTYALQEVLRMREGHEVEIIDFRSKESEEMYSIFPKRPWVDKRVFVNALMHFSCFARQRREYENFRQNFLNFSSKKYRTISDLKELDGVYDVVVTGSDQVWNVTMFDHSEAFFLGWSTKSKNISYAASLGGHKLDETGRESDIKKWLKSFDKISVRESKCVPYMNDVCNRTDVELCLDPTLLIESEDWKNVAVEKCVEGEYIFYYSWAYNNDYINRLVEKFAIEKKLPVYVINASKWIKYKPKQYGFTLCEKGGPEAFLSLMKHARYSLVQSFHGVIFSYQMKKDFWFLDDVPEEKMDKRLEQILILLHAKNRVLRTEEDIKKITKEAYDYGMDLDELKVLREKSLEYLRSINNMD